MPYYGCTKCHHEFEGRDATACDWCGSPVRVLEESTPLERMIASGMHTRIAREAAERARRARAEEVRP